MGEPNWRQSSGELRQPRQTRRRSTCRATPHEPAPEGDGKVRKGKEEAGGARGQGGQQGLQELELGCVAPAEARGQRGQARRQEGRQEGDQGGGQGAQGLQEGAAR